MREWIKRYKYVRWSNHINSNSKYKKSSEGKYHKRFPFFPQDGKRFRDIPLYRSVSLLTDLLFYNVDRETLIPTTRRLCTIIGSTLLFSQSALLARADHLYIAVTIYTVSKMPGFGILVIRTNERGATAVKKWNTIRSTSRSSPPLEARGLLCGRYYEWNRAKPVRCAGLGASGLAWLSGLCERESFLRSPPGRLNGTERKKFVWSFFRRHNKNAPVHRHRRHRHYLDLLCAQVAASQAVTHPAGFLRTEKGATMEGAR